MSAEIITKYTGPFAQATTSINGDADHCQISIKNNGKTKVIFQGSRYSLIEYNNRLIKEKANE